MLDSIRLWIIFLVWEIIISDHNEDTARNVEKYLDFGEIVIDDKGKGFKYANVSFNRSYRKSTRES